MGSCWVDACDIKSNKSLRVDPVTIERYESHAQELSTSPAILIVSPQSLNQSSAEISLDTRDHETALAELVLKLTHGQLIDLADYFVHGELSGRKTVSGEMG